MITAYFEYNLLKRAKAVDDDAVDDNDDDNDWWYTIYLLIS